MKNLIGAVVLAGSLVLAGSAFAQDINNDGCVDQSETISAVVGATSPGTKVELQNDHILVFSNPNESTYFSVYFENGCFVSSDVIDPVAFDSMKTGI